MKNIGFMLLFILALTAPARAESGAAPSWQIVPEDSRLEFEGTQMGAPFKGSFAKFGGTIHFDPNNLAGSQADIIIAIDSADATSPDRNKYLRMADWFDAARFPQARFVTTAFEKGLDTNQFIARGNLTIRDRTLPVILPFTLRIDATDSGGSVAKMTGETTINRLDFGVGQGQWSDTKTVENPVKLRVTLVARQVETDSP